MDSISNLWHSPLLSLISSIKIASICIIVRLGYKRCLDFCNFVPVNILQKKIKNSWNQNIANKKVREIKIFKKKIREIKIYLPLNNSISCISLKEALCLGSNIRNFWIASTAWSDNISSSSSGHSKLVLSIFLRG